MKYHEQGYQFRLSSGKGSALYINGAKLNGAYDEKTQTYSAKCCASDPTMRVGLNRVVIEIPPDNGDGAVRLLMSNPGDVKYLADAPPEMNPTIHVDDWPSTVISNGLITATVAIPDLAKGFYRGNRFEQAGLITKLEREGHTFFLDASAVHAPLNSSECCGPCEEWFDAIAFSDAQPGEAFIKLGVGLYEKPCSTNHQWYSAYWPIKMFPWTVEVAEDKVEFVQEVDGPRGWGYRYVKRLILVPGKPVLRIEHTLTNTGKRHIEAEQYAHNFMALDRKPVGKGLTVSFSFPPKTGADLSTLGVIEGNRLVVTNDKAGTKMIPIEGWAPDSRDVVATITMPGVAAGLRISGDFSVSKLAIFLDPKQISCEPFTKVSLEPGATVSWTRSYEFLLEGR